jgi:hypothetical protein
LAEKKSSARVSSVSMPGPEWIVVIGGVVSARVHSYSVQIGFTWPPGSVARTAKMCSPNGTSL